MLQTGNDHIPDRMEIIRAPYPYPGSKKESLNKILTYLPYTDVFVDGFGGSGIVTLNRERSKLDVFNDRHAGIVAFYRCLKDDVKREQLINKLHLTVFSREEYIWCKTTWQHDTLDDVERAARWYYSVVNSFGGVGRNFGRALAPVASLVTSIAERIPHFHNVHDRFKTVQIENLDWRTLLKDYDSPDTVFYLDPPYYGLTTYLHEFTKQEHWELCERIFECQGFVALSGYDNTVYNQFKWDAIYKWPATVTVKTNAAKTEPLKGVGLNESEECLYIKEFS